MASNNSGFLPKPKGFATAAIHHFQEPERNTHNSVVPPLYVSTTFKQLAPATPKTFYYGRSGNPNREILQNCIAKLENAQYGLCFASGLGAVSSIMGMLKAGDHIIAVDDIYGGTSRLFNQVYNRFNIEITTIDGLDPADVDKVVKPNTKILWIESPTNPTMKIIDIEAMAQAAHKHNILLIVDNTFLTPYFQRPLELGADIVVHSITKYLNGHSDVVMGAIATNNEDLFNKLNFLQRAMGIVPGPFDCFQVTRSLKTLAVRMEKHAENSLIVAKYLEKHPKVIKVIHPGLPSHPQYDLAKRQTSGWSGMLSFYLKGGMEESKKFLSSLQIFTLAESLGGYESLAELPSVMTHASVPAEQREILNISDNLVRLSVGLEDAEDLLGDLEQALEKI